MNWGTLCWCLGWTSRACTYRFRTTEILHFPKEPRTVLWQGILLLEIDAHILPLVTTDLLLFKVGTSPYVTSSYLLDKIPSSSEVGKKSCTFGGTEVGPDNTSSLCPRPLCLSKADARTPGSQASDDSTGHFHQMVPFFHFCPWVSLATLPSATSSFFLQWFWDTGSRKRAQKAPFQKRKSLRN